MTATPPSMSPEEIDEVPYDLKYSLACYLVNYICRKRMIC